MQNKPNLPKAQMNLTSLITVVYENKSNWTLGENKPNTNPIRTQSNPIKANKMPKQTQYKPNQSQFQKGHRAAPKRDFPPQGVLWRYLLSLYRPP